MIIISKTKLQVPQVRTDELPRPALVHRATTAVLAHPLTLLSAPAGAGKTTLAAHVVGTLKAQSHGASQVAWLRLDTSDNDPQTFLTALVLALRTVEPALGREVLPLIDGAPEPARALCPNVTLLLNELHDQPEPLVLVLDDYHTIVLPVIHEAVDHLLAHLPPPVHLIIATRYDPPLALARLRMRGHLTEVRLRELQFDARETHSYLQTQLDATLSDEQIAHLQARTQGWIAGVRLLALTLETLHDPAERDLFIRRFSRSNQLIFDLLAREVLAQQPEPLRQFLLLTSILDELTPELCLAVTQNREAGHLLVEAYRRNLFLSATDPYASAETTYRYHDLFADLLRRTLQEEDEAAYRAAHQRAAEANSDPVRAIEHYLAAGAWPTASDAIIAHAMPQLRHRYITPQTIAWVNQLPETLREADEWLRLITTFHRSQTGETSPIVIEKLQAIRAAFQAADELQGEYITLIALTHAMGGYDWQVLQEAEAFFAAHPTLVTDLDRVVLLISLAWSAEFRGDWAALTAYLRQMLALYTGQPELHFTLGQGFGSQFLFSDLGIEPFEALFDHVYASHGDGEQLVHFGYYNHLSALRFYQARVDEASILAHRARQLKTHLGDLAWQSFTFDHVEVHRMLAQGEYAALERYVQTRQPGIEADPSLESFATALPHLLARAYWHAGRTEDLARLVSSLPEPGGERVYMNQQRTYLLGHAWLAIAEQRFADGVRLLGEALAIHERQRSVVASSHPRLDLACLYWLWHQKTGEAQHLALAVAHLDAVLAEVSERGMPGILLQSGRVAIPLLRHALPEGDYATVIVRALEAFGEVDEFRPLPIPNSNEALTPREVEVLHLLMAGATNREIADHLVITTRTAKAHVSNILQKLGVSSRTQAVVRARDWSLL